MIYDIVYDKNEKADYDAYSLHDLDETCRRTYNALRKIRNEFDSIIVTGMSGVVVGVPVALKLKKPVVVVRKEKDDSHQYSGKIGAGQRVINRHAVGKRTVIVDDFHSTGDTERTLIAAAESMGAATVATYWYRDHEVVHHDSSHCSGTARIVDEQGEQVGDEIPF